MFDGIEVDEDWESDDEDREKDGGEGEKAISFPDSEVIASNGVGIVVLNSHIFFMFFYQFTSEYSFTIHSSFSLFSNIDNTFLYHKSHALVLL